jgi:hypothetical protein
VSIVQVNLTLQVALSGSVTMPAVGQAKAAPEAGGEAVRISDHGGVRSSGGGAELVNHAAAAHGVLQLT